jgi:NADH-quinone oxidoreductase subunit A
MVFYVLALTTWAKIGIYAGLLLVIAGAVIALSYLFGPRHYSAEKFTPYECGVPLLEDTRGRFSVKFYLIAILFILFDIETVFLIPWALVFRQLGWIGIAEMFTFMFVLAFGILYIWRRGIFNWD